MNAIGSFRFLFPKTTRQLPLPDRCFPNSRGHRFWGVSEPIRFLLGGRAWLHGQSRGGACAAEESLAGCVEGCLIPTPSSFFFFFPLSVFFFFFYSPGVLLISLWGCGWRPWSVGNDARSFNYRNGWTSVRKTDRGKKGDRNEEKQRSTPTPSPFPSRFGPEVQRGWRES